MRRTLGTAPTVKKAPVGDGELVALLATLGDGLAGLRDRALLTLGWSSACRRSELVALDVADLEFQTDGLHVRVRHSKDDQKAKGLDKAVPYASAPALCAVRAVHAWLDAAGITEGAVFRAVDRYGRVAKSRLSDRTVARVVQRAALAAGFDPARYGGHSLRSGFMMTAAEKGPLEAIMRLTGQRSRASRASTSSTPRLHQQRRQGPRVNAEGPSVLVTLRLSARDRALLEALVVHEHRELEDLGVEVSLSSVMRKLIRAAAKGAALDVFARAHIVGAARTTADATAAAPKATRATRAVSQNQVRVLLRKKTAERRGLSAELARALGVERAQVSRFKAGNEAFPAAKLAGLFDLLSASEE